MAFGGGGVRAGKAFVEYVLERKTFDKQLDKLGADLRKWGSIGQKVTAPLIAGFTAAVAVFAKVGSELDDMSQRTGMSVESLSALKYMANQSGTSLAAVETAVKKMSTVLLGASQGVRSHVDTLAALGLTYETLAGMKPEDQFRTISQAIASVENPTLRAALAQKAFGRAGTQLLPMLSQGAEGMAAMEARAKALGLVMSGEAATAAARLDDNLSALWDQLTALAANIGAALAGPLSDFLEWTQLILGDTIRWIEVNPELVLGIAAITGGIAAATTAMVGLGIAISILQKNKIVLFLSVLAGIVSGLAIWMGLASDNADEMKKSLEGVKIPGGVTPAVSEEMERRGIQMQAELQATVSGKVGSAITPAAASGVERMFAKNLDGIERWTKESAETLKVMLGIMRNRDPGFIAGVG